MNTKPRHAAAEMRELRDGLSRRTFLRAAGIAIGLPLLDAMKFNLLAATPGGKGPGATGRRLVAVSYGLSFHPTSFWPTKLGKDYVPSEYLKVLEPLRNDFTVIGGTSHLDVHGGHEAEASFLSAAPYPRQPYKNSISLDQFLAAEMVGVTREPYLVLGTNVHGNAGGMMGGISISSSGTHVPGITSPSALFERLFLTGGGNSVEAQKARLAHGHSVLDAVTGQAKKLRSEVGAGDLDKLEDYMESVRTLEMRMQAAAAWTGRPKPKVSTAKPTDIPEPAKIIERMQLMYDMVHLALQTDSTRVISLFCQDGGAAPSIPGVTREHHDLTHHSLVEEKITQLRLHELAEMAVIHNFLAKLKATKEGDGTLLDKTSVLIGSHMGSAGSHMSQNLPIILAGGGYRHAGYISADDPKDTSDRVYDTRGTMMKNGVKQTNNAALSKLFVTMLQRTGMETDKFAGTTGTLGGLDWKG